MPDQQPVQNEALSSQKSALPDAVAQEFRKLSHDLSNALEIVVQTSYLLGTIELKEPASEWLRLLDEGVSKSLALNNALRASIRQHSS